MNNKERAMQLIESIPDSKLIFVVDMPENLKAYAGEEITPDEWDLKTDLYALCPCSHKADL